MTPWIIVLSTVAAVGNFDLRLIGSWALIHTVTLSLAILPLLLVRAVLIRRGVTEVGIGTLVMAGIVLGATKGSLTSLAEAALGLSDESANSIWLRIIGASFAAVWLLLLTAYIRTGLEQLENSRAKLVRQNVATRLATETHNSRPELRAPLEKLTRLRHEVASGLGPTSADNIRDVVDDTIRPIARALWSAEEARYPQIKLAKLLRLSLESAPPPGLAIVLIWAPLSFIALTAQVGLVPNLGYTLASTVVALIGWQFVRSVISRMIPIAVVIITLFSVAAVSLGALIASQLIEGLFNALTPLVIIFGAVWMTFVVIGVSIVSGALAISEVIARDLASHDSRALVDSQSNSAMAQITSRRLAAMLHGEVQGSLLGLAAAIEQNRLDAREVAARLEGVINALHQLQDNALPDVATGSRQQANEQITEVLDAWKGLMQIVLDGPSREELCKLLTTRPEILELIREALTNGHRHGNATRVVLSVTLDSGAVIVRLTDNGYGPRRGDPGLGTALLDRLAPGSWSLTRVEPTGSQLEIHFLGVSEHA